MNTIIPTRVAELSATLKPITQDEHTAYITGDMAEEAEDYCSYNASFYCNGWIKPVFDGYFRGCLLQKAEDFQVLRFYEIQTQLIGLAYDEIPEDWDDDDAPDYPEMEVLGLTEIRQIFFNRDETYTIDLTDSYDNYCETYVCHIADFHDWIYEPRFRDFVLDTINEHRDNTIHSHLAYILSPCGEMLAKRAPLFNEKVLSLGMTSDAMRVYKSLKVALRHDYQLPTDSENVRLYLDYLVMLSRIGNIGNITNPQLVCPADIHTAHDSIMAKRMEIEREEEIRKARLLEAEFAKNHSWLFGIEFESDHFHYQSLDSVEAYRVEGEIMHHCIYRMGYYNKHYMLALHIQDFEGNRVATCTIDLERRSIEQIQPIGNATGFKNNYGINWQECNDYKEIWNCLMARMHTFPKRNRQKKLLRKSA